MVCKRTKNLYGSLAFWITRFLFIIIFMSTSNSLITACAHTCGDASWFTFGVGPREECARSENDLASPSISEYTHAYMVTTDGTLNSHISIVEINEDGKQTEFPTIANIGLEVKDMVADPSHENLYLVGGQGTGYLIHFKINSDGTLTGKSNIAFAANEIPRKAVIAQRAPTHLSILYTDGIGSDVVRIYDLSSDGTPINPRDTSLSPWNIISMDIESTGSYLYFTQDAGSMKYVRIYERQSDNTISYIDRISVSFFPVGIKCHPRDNGALIITSGANIALSIQFDGSNLQIVDGVSLVPLILSNSQINTENIAISYDEEYMYILGANNKVALLGFNDFQFDAVVDVWDLSSEGLSLNAIASHPRTHQVFLGRSGGLPLTSLHDELGFSFSETINYTPTFDIIDMVVITSP